MRKVIQMSQRQISGNGEEKSMSLQEVFLVNHSPSQAKERERMITAISGLTCSGPYMRSGPIGSLVRTLLASSRWYSPVRRLKWEVNPLYSERVSLYLKDDSNMLLKPFAVILNAKDIPSSRYLYRLVPSVHLTDGIEFGLLPTVTAQDYKRRGPGSRQQGLPEIIHGMLLPTPVATEIHHAERVRKWKSMNLSSPHAQIAGEKNPNGLTDFLDFYGILPEPIPDNTELENTDGKIWFCASDVAAALGYSNPRDAVVRHCKPMGVVVYDTPTRSAVQKIKYISEGNVYRLIAGSKLPSAEKFESWIFDELVPETLKNGGYLLKKNGETDNELLARAILLAQNRIKERDSRISALEKENNYAILKLKLQAPKVQYYDKVLQSQSTYTTTQIAKELGMTAGMLNKRLRWAGIQFRQSGQWLLKAPYQNQGYTATRTHVWESRTGETGTAMLTVWTEKGRLFIHYLFEAYLV